MATAELSREAQVPRGQLSRVWVSSWMLLWVATTVAALLTALTPGAGAAAREVLGARLLAVNNPSPSLAAALALAAHNAPMFGWPLLLAVFAIDRCEAARRSADLLAGGWLAANVAQVGTALGAYGERIIAFLPQLPSEWAALALGTTVWRLQRHRALSSKERLLLGLGVVMLAAGAAVAETWRVPHR